MKELAVIKAIQANPTVTQQQIAPEIEMSARTVKTITTNLTEKGIIVRKNGKRNGYWEMVAEEL